MARAFTKLMGAFVTFWDNDAGSKIQLLANPNQDMAPIGTARQEDSLLQSQMRLQYPLEVRSGAPRYNTKVKRLSAGRPAAALVAGRCGV